MKDEKQVIAGEQQPRGIHAPESWWKVERIGGDAAQDTDYTRAVSGWLVSGTSGDS